ncbi:MAG: hypothetical protein BHV84_04330 [Prevotella sp. AG:487_50_53]|nr:MAG: hypothetical protein BHV84_04330 [Prevotella sp. AG:487_50_53]
MVVVESASDNDVSLLLLPTSVFISCAFRKDDTKINMMVDMNLDINFDILIAKIMQGERNGKMGKQSFTFLDTAEPLLIFLQR